MRLRMGIAYGTLLVRLGEIFGDPVNIAARLQQRAEPGGVCIAEAAWRMLPAAQQRGLNALGPQQFKNIAEPVHTYIWHPHTAGRKA
jgi:adenylate cyclase